MPPGASRPSKSDRNGEEDGGQPKRPAKRKKRVQASVIIQQSQDDGGDEVVWKVSPTAERLQSTATGGPQSRALGEGRSVLQPCQASHNKCEPVLEILSKTSTRSNSKKKKSPGMAGKLEMWLSSSQEVHDTKSVTDHEGKTDLPDADKENDLEGYCPNNAESKKGITPKNAKTRPSNSKRPPTSAQRRSTSAKKKLSTSVFKDAANPLGLRRKALLDLLDKVDDAVKGSMLIQSKLSFTRKGTLAAEESNGCKPEPIATGKAEKVHCETVLLPAPQVVPAHANELIRLPSVGQAFNEPNEIKDLGVDNIDVLSKVGTLDIRSESNDAGQFLPATRDLRTSQDFENVVKTPRRISRVPGSQASRNLASIQFLVLEVADGEHEESRISSPQKILTLLDEDCGLERVAYLRDTWFHAVVKPGDTVNVIGKFDTDGKCVIDREHNLMVINPDFLVSGSKVGSSFYCSRRAVLDERIKSNDVSYPALMGTMLHQLFQVALRCECPTLNMMNDEVKSIVQRHLDGIYATGVSDREVYTKLVASIPAILRWWKQFVGVKDSPAQEVEFGKIHGRQSVSVTEVVDIEEMVWSPKYGLKGMIDASILVKMGNMNLGGEDLIMPFELKTGKATTGQAATEHRAQVILYTLLMSDRYMRSVRGGLLYYLHTNQTEGVEVQHRELAGLMMQRNEHATNLLKASFDQSLPPMLQNYQKCQNCQQLDTCTIYHKAQERGTGESSGLGELFDRSTSHLSKAHLQFFQKWDRLIDLEARNGLATHSEIWRMPSGKREEQGRCISSLVLDTAPENSNEQNGSAKSFMYRFRRASSYEDTSSHVTQSSQASFHGRSFSCGDYVILSTENGHPAVAGGIVINVTEDSILLRLAHRLRIPGDLKMASNLTASQELWRIDKDDIASHLAIMRFNLLQLFVKTNGDAQRRSLIVDHQAPKFESTLLDSDPAAVYLKSVNGLNDDQIPAIHKIICARDYALILGMPGTGKTSTIVHAVIALLARKATVLLTSYTNSAVDNILLRLKKLGVDFVRVGRPEAIHPELRDKALSGKEVTSVKEFQSIMEKAQVVGVTCFGISHPLFAKHKFDVCIVDEAGQITLPVCVGPLRYARSFVLVGDHYQLPPLVRSPEARDEGMAVSLFRRLSEKHPQSVSVLQSQYRMCSGIMALSNSLIYNNRLLCGSPQIAAASLQVHQSSKNLPPWLSEVVNPGQPLLFLDTDNLSAEESRIHNNITNPTEATILLRVIRALSDGGIDIEKIGVISPYNAQVDLIQRVATKEGFSNLEVHTVDKYQVSEDWLKDWTKGEIVYIMSQREQSFACSLNVSLVRSDMCGKAISSKLCVQGREKDCVLISFVRSNSHRQLSGSLLADWHRINVAITRAKTKLVMIGSQKTLSSTPILRLLMEKVGKVGSLLPLPSNATMNMAW